MTRIEIKAKVESKAALNQPLTLNLHNCYCYYCLSQLSFAMLWSMLEI
jgi:hypothetical protein